MSKLKCHQPHRNSACTQYNLIRYTVQCAFPNKQCPFSQQFFCQNSSASASVKKKKPRLSSASVLTNCIFLGLGRKSCPRSTLGCYPKRLYLSLFSLVDCWGGGGGGGVKVHKSRCPFHDFGFTDGPKWT